MLLLLNLLMMVQDINMQLTAEMFSCSDETKSPILHFAENTHIEICCQVMPDFCNNTTSNDNLTLLPQFETGCNGSCASQMYRESKCLVKFEISNSSFLDQGRYFCKKNENPLLTQNVTIVKMPPTPVITSFSCSHTNVRNVTFDRGPPDSRYNDLYVVNMTEFSDKKSKTFPMCNTTQEVCKPNSHICTCNMTLQGVINASNKVNISVTIIRSLWTSEVWKTFPIASHIIPGPVMRLNVSHVGPHNASIKFCMDKASQMLCKFMVLNNAPLHFNVKVLKEQGVSEILKVTIPTEIDVYPFCVHKCKQVNLTNLTALTKYTVIVSSIGGGGEGSKSLLEFSTSQTEPVSPSVIEDFGFRRLDHNVSDNLLPGLLVFWKPLPHEEKGAREFCYYIEVTSENGFRVNKTTADEYAVIFDKHLPAGPLAVKLWSQNVLGRSSNYTKFDIPPKIPETAVPNVVVELKEDRAFVYVNLTLHTNVTLFVHWCNNEIYQKESGVTVCQDYPSMAVFTLNAAPKKTYQTLEVNISDSMELEVIQKYRLINYYNIHYLNSPLGMPITSNATVILNDLRASKEIKDNKDQGFYVEIHDSGDDDLYYEYEVSRKRRSFSDTNIKFFISFKIGDSMSSTGLIPANCYYDATKDKVALVVSDFLDSSRKHATLRWSQQCNTDEPLQFLAEYYQVFSSTDEHCNENKIYLDTVSNSLFQPNLLKLPPGTIFTCIQAYRKDGKGAAQFTSAVGRHNYEQTSESDLAGIVVPIIVVLSVFIVLIFLCLNLNRKKHIEKNIEKNKTTGIELPSKDKFGADPHAVNSRSTSKDEELTNSMGQISFNTSADSGRGTDSDSHTVNIEDKSNEYSSTSSTGSAITGSPSDSSHLNSDLPGNSSSIRQVFNNESGSKNNEKNGSTTSGQVVNQNSETDDERSNESGRSQERSNESGRSQEQSTERDQQKALEKRGFVFIAISCNSVTDENSSSDMEEEKSQASDTECNSCNSITDKNICSDMEEEKSHASNTEFQQHDAALCSNNDIRQSFKRPESAGHFGQQLKNHNPHDTECRPKGFNRCFSSGSESEGDVERPLMSSSCVRL